LVATVAFKSDLEYHTGKTSERICDAFLSTDEYKEIDLIMKLEYHMSKSNKV
jgi:hypothetical protein